MNAYRAVCDVECCARKIRDLYVQISRAFEYVFLCLGEAEKIFRVGGSCLWEEIHVGFGIIFPC